MVKIPLWLRIVLLIVTLYPSIFDIYFICILSDVSTILCYITYNLLYLVNAINDCLLSFQRCFLK